MSLHAGFAAALVIPESVLATAATIAFDSGQISQTFDAGSLFASATGWIDPPKISCHQNEHSAVSVDIHGWGTTSILVSVDPAVPQTVQRLIAFRARTNVEVAFFRKTPASALTLQFPAASTTLVYFETIDGIAEPLNPAVTPQRVETEISDFVRNSFAGFSSSVLTNLFQLDALGLIATDPSAVATVLVVDGAVLVGLDITNVDDGTRRISTLGTPGALRDFAGDNEIAAVINTKCINLALPSAAAAFAAKAAKEDAEITGFDLALNNGFIDVIGGARNSSGHTEFSLKAVPHLFRPSKLIRTYQDEDGRTVKEMTTESNELWFEPVDVEVSVAASGWRSWFDDFFLTDWIADIYLGEAHDEVVNHLNTAASGRVRRVFEDFTISGTTEPIIHQQLTAFTCSFDELVTTTRWRTTLPPGRVVGPRFYPIEFADQQTLSYRVDLPYAAKSDPTLRVQWTIRRRDTNAVVLSVGGSFDAKREIGVSDPVVPIVETDKFHVDCRVFRPLGGRVDEIFQTGFDLDRYQSDIVDIRHPYVRWRHTVRVPSVEVAPDGRRTILGYPLRRRQSAIHRTDVFERCSNIVHMSIGGETIEGIPPTNVGIEYLDELPFPITALNQHRKELCEYCFFGGPGSTTPLIH